jgi:general secretion pathway protein I
MGSGSSKCGDARARRARAPGFTLIEVLVALTIVAVALMASLRAAGSLTQSSQSLRARMLAQWSAENRLAQIRVQGEFPNPGQTQYDCSHGGVSLLCQESVFTTPNVSFRRIEIAVADPADKHQLARLVGFATNLP